MLALYGSGRQAEALDVYRDTRRLLVDELGIEPGPAIQQLEQAILRQDPALDSPAPEAAIEGIGPSARGAITVVVGETDALDGLLAIAEPLAREPPRELIIARLLASHDRIEAATAELAETRSHLEARGVSSRVAAYTTHEPGAEAVLLATQYDAALLLLAAADDAARRRRLSRTSS